MSEAQSSPRIALKSLSLPQSRKAEQTYPKPHQARALKKLRLWYESLGGKAGGGILVFPTGAGKTFTAVNFLCAGPLSDGHKVLWLAHTHHLLDQAFNTFHEGTVGGISEPRRELRLRVVSGTPGHYPPRDVKKDDDVIIATLQTVTNAYREQEKSLMGFLHAAGKKLLVVFDEAHHAPAPTYRKLLTALQERPAAVLGLTATPVYSDESRQGWLKKLFPQGILAQERTGDLIAAKILARPRAITMKTTYVPTFEGAEYQKWLKGTFRDVPERVVDALAENKERNAFIAKTYAENRKTWGKTIIFTDRWYQCEAIAAALAKYGVQAGSVYSHVDAVERNAALRKQRDRDENQRVLESFRAGKIDVLINVRMLTEGTDFPQVKTVFLTRQTTSQILLTQMVGRALRGPALGGTDEANIVSFEDDWRTQIQWAEFELAEGGTAGGERPSSKRLPLQLISIDLVQKLAKQMLGGVNVATAPFKTLLPLGWYRAQFDTRVDDGDDVEPEDLLVMVFEDERLGFEALIQKLLAKVPASLASEDATLEQHRGHIEGWRKFFLGGANRNPADLDVDIVKIARHVAQRETPPLFYPFEMRAEHDLDKLAQHCIDSKLDMMAIDQAVLAEYEREDRFWKALFPEYENFWHFYEGCQRRIVNERRPARIAPKPTPAPTQPEGPSNAEPDEDVKAKVRERDGHTCLACGARKPLQVDHVVSAYHSGSKDLDNLQTLCKRCNRLKGTKTIRFRDHATPLEQPQSSLKEVPVPDPADAANPQEWARFLRCTINFFFQCAAVKDVEIAGRGEGYYNWVVTLRRGNQPEWLKSHLPGIVERIQRVREAARKPRIASLRIEVPGHWYIVYRE